MLFPQRSLQVNVVVCVKLHGRGSCCVSSQPGDWRTSSASPEKTSESVVYQLSGTGFQVWNAVSEQRLLGEVLNAHLFF